MMRFVEVCIGSGKPYSSFLNQKKNSRNFIPIVIGLESDREIMYDRINRRVDIMINEGLLEEAKNLFPNKQLNALQTVGYSEWKDYFEQKISRDDNAGIMGNIDLTRYQYGRYGSNGFE